MVKLFVLIALAFAFSKATYAYPQFIGKGYHACLTCHYNPFGNGPLNDYGRGVAATGLAGRFLIPDSVTDDTLGQSSSIIFGKPDKLFIKPSIDYRGLLVQTNLQDTEAEDNEKWFNMQAEMSLSANWGKKKEYVVTVSYNTLIANNPNTPGRDRALAGKEPGEDLSYIREAYFGYRVNENLGVYLGKTDKIYGIRIPDHNLANRKYTRNNYNSSVPQVMVHYGTQDYDGGISIYQEPAADVDNEKTNANDIAGFSGKYEYSLNKKWRVGLSYLNETDQEDDSKFSAAALIAKTRVGEGSSVMAELGSLNTEPSAGDPTTGQYIYIQSYMYMKRGLYFVTTYEQYSANTDNYNENHAFAPGIQWMPMQRFEFRADLFNRKIYSSDGGQRDSWELQGQVHLWF